jgi:O-acetyl-ADP-ribose deacetylase
MIGGCPTEEAPIMKAYDLPHTHVIHAVGPRYLDGARGEPETPTRCYQSIYLMGKTR